MPAKVRALITFLLGSLMATISVYSYRSAYNYKKATEWVNHTQQVIAEANSVLADIQDIVIDEKGFVILGDSSYLIPYKSGIKSIQDKYFVIRNLVQDNPGQEVLLDSINTLIAAKVRFTQQVINARANSGFAGSQTILLTRGGEIIMKQLKTLLNEFTLKERLLLAQRLDRAKKSYSWAVTFIIIGVILTLFIILISYYLLNRDYKQRLKSEMKVKESELLMRKFLNSIPLGILILGKDGKLYFANDKAAEILGKGLMPNATPENLSEIYSIVKAGTNEMYPPEKLPLVRAINGEKNVLVDDMEVLKKPKNTPLRVNATSVFNAEGEVEYAISIFEDITDMQEANRKIKESEEKFYKAFAISPVAFAINDSETGKYIEANDSFAQLTGYSREEIIGKSSVEVGIMVDVKSRERIMQNIRQHGTMKNAELVIRNKDGRMIDMLTSAETLTLKGRKCTLSINYDITTLKESERRLIEANKLAEESAHLKEAFLANMSHEIRTPMNAIVGFTELLLKKSLDEEQRDYVETIKSSGENLLRIINDVLDISKIESGAMVFEKSPISVKELFHSLHSMMMPKAVEKKLELTFEYPPDMPDTIIGDPTRLTQIIINLVGNALKFTEKGSVTVLARVLNIEASRYIIEFSIKDTGVGIPEDKLKYIFERFRQAESFTTRHYGGTGLGLSIAKQLVEMQGGEITVKSVEGIGSEFIFSLPFKKADDAEKKVDKTITKINLEELSKLAILMVEDNLINIKFIQSLFKDYKIHTDIARNGKEAIEKFVEKNYDMVLMDIEMPEMNGYETTDIIRKKFKSGIPIIAMTANAMAGEREKCLKMGMDDYISKPIKADSLFVKMYNAAFKKEGQNNKAKKAADLTFLVTSMNGRKDVIRETIDLFIEQIPQDMGLLEHAVTTENYEAIKQCAHKIKSAVSLMGMTELQNMLNEMELLAASGSNFEKIKILFSDVVALNEEAMSEIQEERSNFV